MAKAAKIKFKKSISEIVGTSATFEIEFNPQPRTYKMVSYLRDALSKNPVAKSNWEKLIPSRQKEIMRYFSWLKSPEAKDRNLKNLLEALTGKEKRFMARTWKNGK